MAEEGQNNSKYPKSYVITAAQAIQSERHGKFYGPDRTKGTPNIPLMNNIDRYARINKAETMILQMAGMSCDEIHLHSFFEKRDDVYINKNRLARLEAEIDRKRESLEERIDIIDERIGRLLRKDKPGDTLKLKERLADYTAKLQEVRDADYFDVIGLHPLNSKVMVADLIVPPQNVDPSTSRLEISQTQLGKTIIFAHAKQRWKSAPKSMGGKYPRLLITTGACTLPNYNGTNDRGDNASWNHKYGFVVVDVVDSRRFFPRIVPAFKNGAFVDMGKLYIPNERPKRIGVEAMVLGDIHYGDHDPLTIHANYEMMEFFKPKNVFLHDAFNGHSMNPHEREDSVKRAIAFKKGRLDIKREFEEAYDEFVGNMVKDFPKTNFWFVYSNHSPDFIRRYLTSFQFAKEPWNDTEFVSHLRGALLREGDAIESGFEMLAEEYGRRKLPPNINFLSLKEGKRILGYELGAHGHKGANGARGSPENMRKGHGKGISGHTHSPDIKGDWTVVGTSSKIPLEYAEGQPGSQMPANAVIYNNGLSQLIPIIVGNWKK